MHAIDVSAENFQQEVLDKSFEVPVVVDFWAPWCGPCQVLKPLLEKLAEEYNGKFILAKINSDENQELAAQFQVRGIPSVKAVIDGGIVNEFSGALPESAVREFLDEILPSEADKLRQQAMQSYVHGDLDNTLSLLEQSLQLEPENYKTLVAKAQVLLAKQQAQEAKDILLTLPANIQSEDVVKEMLTKIELMLSCVDLPDEQTLLQNIETDSSDLQSRLDLAQVYINHESYENALEQCFEIIRQDRAFGDDIGRKTVLSIFTLLGNQNPLVKSARRQLSSLLN